MATQKQPIFKRLWTNISNIFLPIADYRMYEFHSNYEAAKGVINPESYSTVFTCLRILSETIAKLPLNLVQYTGTEKIILKDNPLHKLMKYSPNNYQTSSTMFSTFETQRNMQGNAYAYIDRKGGRPSSLEVIYPTVVVSAMNNQNFAYIVKAQIVDGQLFYVINRNGIIETVSGDNILHFKGITLDGYFGLSPVQALKKNLDMMHNAFMSIDGYYRNNTFSTKFLKSTVNTSNKKVLDEAVDNINKNNAHPANAGKFVVLPPFTEMQNVNMSFVDMEFISSIKWNKVEIASLYGIPGFMVGESEGLRFSNIEQMMLGFKSTTIHNITSIYEDELNFKLLTQKQRDMGWEFEFDLSALVEVDFSTRINGYKALFNMGVITPNQMAMQEGYPIYPEGDKHYIPTNNMTSPEDVKPEENPETPADEKKEQMVGESEEDILKEEAKSLKNKRKK